MQLRTGIWCYRVTFKSKGNNYSEIQFVVHEIKGKSRSPASVIRKINNIKTNCVVVGGMISTKAYTKVAMKTQ